MAFSSVISGRWSKPLNSPPFVEGKEDFNLHSLIDMFAMASSRGCLGKFGQSAAAITEVACCGDKDLTASRLAD
jgi:hypothetical protein